MAFLTPDKARTEHGLVIKEKIIPWNGTIKKANRKLSGGTGKVQYITIHNTADVKEAPGTTDAEQYARATYAGNMNDVRVHYYIDDRDCWQLLRENEVGWHAADGNGPGNEQSIAIEIIMSGKGDAADKGAEKRGALLAAILLKRHGLGIDRLKTHNHWMGQPDRIVSGVRKNCPQYILPHWQQFVSEVKANIEKMQKSETEEEMVIYKTLKDIPDWGKPTIQKLVSDGMLKGNEKGELNISEDMLRILMILERKNVL